MSIDTNTDVMLVKTLTEVRSLEREWRTLESHTPEATGFQAYQWCDAWLNSSAAQGKVVQPRIVVVRKRQEIVFLLPLQIQRVFGLRCARSIGQPATQYQDALALPGHDRLSWLDAAKREIKSWGDVDLLHLPQVRERSVILAGLRPYANSNGSKAPYTPLRTSRILGFGEKSRTKSMRRRLRHLRASGDIQLAQIDGTEAQENYITQISTWKTERLREKGLGRRGLSSKICRPFFLALARDRKLCVHVLFLDDVPVAGELGIVSNDTYRSLLSAFNGAFGRYAPGHALTEFLMDKLSAEGLAYYDFLAPAEPYKRLWCQDDVGVSTVMMPISRRGAVAIKVRQRSQMMREVLDKTFCIVCGPV